MTSDDWCNAPPPARPQQPARQPPVQQQPAQPRLTIHPPPQPKLPMDPVPALVITVLVGGIVGGILSVSDAGYGLLVFSITGVVASVFAIAAGVELGAKRAILLTRQHRRE